MQNNQNSEQKNSGDNKIQDNQYFEEEEEDIQEEKDIQEEISNVQIQEEFHFICTYDYEENYVKDFLKQNPDIDLTYREGIYFDITAVKNKINQMKILLKHYEKKKIKVLDMNKSLFARRKLNNIFQEIIEYYTLEQEMLNLISQYIYIQNQSSTDDLHRQSDFDDLNISLPFNEIQIIM